MFIAREGLREIVLATVILGACVAVAVMLYTPLAILFGILWLAVLGFFRDPRRRGTYQAGELCAPADGTVVEVATLETHQAIGGPAYRIAVFLSLLNVHINRSPCAGTVRSLSYQAGSYHNARSPEAGRRNESNTLLIDPAGPMPGPVVVRQVAGLLARRIVCHARVDQRLPAGARFGLIKFGSRTELIIPRLDKTEIKVEVGSKVRAGLTIVACQPVDATRSKVGLDPPYLGDYA